MMNQFLSQALYGSFDTMNHEDEIEKKSRKDGELTKRNRREISDKSKKDHDSGSCTFPFTAWFALLVVGMWRPVPARYRDDDQFKLLSLVVDDGRKFENEENVAISPEGDNLSDHEKDDEDALLHVDFISLQETHMPKKSRSKLIIIFQLNNK